MSIDEKATHFAGLPVVEYQPATGLVLPVMPRTELRSDRKPDQLWAIALEQDRVITWSGQVVTGGRKQARKLASPAAAREEYCELVAEKVAAGWAPLAVHRAFHLPGGKAPKFWTITVSGRRRTVLSGKAGTQGTVVSRSFKTEEAARADAERLIAERVAEGYVEQRPAAGSLREALVAAVRASPDDAASRNAFADYLSEHGERLPAAAYRVDGDEYGEGGFPKLMAFLNDPAVHLVEALVVGCCWGAFDGSDSSRVVKALIAARGRLTGLRALFLGDITYRENEISWIRQCDLTRLLEAFPDLEHFRARGGADLVLRPFRHDRLRSLAFEASNLPASVVRAVGASKLPALEHLELWLGTGDYGADTTPADLKGVFQGKHLPSLRYLGLRNSHIADDVTRALAKAPVLERLRVLDLSLGALTDAGAEALLAIPAVARLERLDIHHHYVSPAMVERLKALGVPVDASDPQEPDDFGDDTLYRFVAHSE
jgi:uncharacterized protein (TIGR02996 family)